MLILITISKKNQDGTCWNLLPLIKGCLSIAFNQFCWWCKEAAHSRVPDTFALLAPGPRSELHPRSPGVPKLGETGMMFDRFYKFPVALQPPVELFAIGVLKNDLYTIPKTIGSSRWQLNLFILATISWTVWHHASKAEARFLSNALGPPTESLVDIASSTEEIHKVQILSSWAAVGSGENIDLS